MDTMVMHGQLQIADWRLQTADCRSVNRRLRIELPNGGPPQKSSIHNQAIDTCSLISAIRKLQSTTDQTSRELFAVPR
jgi:hypothetical protein